MKEILISRGAQLLSRYVAGALVFLAGWSNVGVTTDQVTSSSETIGLLFAAGIFGLLDLLLHSIREKMNPPSLIAFLLLPGLLLVSGCGKDQRVLDAHDFTKKSLENSKENHNKLHQIERAAYEREAKEHIDTKFKWDAEKLVTQAKANPAITVQQIVDEMLFKTFLRDKHRNFVALQVSKATDAQAIADKDLNTALKINGQLRDYAAQPGFDFIALIQGLFGSPEETAAQKLPDGPLESLPAEIISFPPGNAAVVPTPAQ